MKNIFITGSTGFLGYAIIRYLRKYFEGITIYALVRENSKTDHLDPYKIIKVNGNLSCPENYKELLAKCDTVFHSAAQIGFESKRKEIFLRTNFEGTKTIVEATNPDVLEHFVFTSTKGTRASKLNQPNNENTKFDNTEILDPYLESKIKAEEYIISKIKNGFPASIILPTGLIGWGDIKPTPMGKLVKDFLDQKIPFIPPGGVDLVDIDDVAKAHVEVVHQKKIGETYIISGRFTTFDELFCMLSNITGLKSPRIRIPTTIFLTLAFIKENIDCLLKKTPSITLKKAKSAINKMESSSEKLIRELGFTPGKVEEALQKSVKYFRTQTLD